LETIFILAITAVMLVYLLYALLYPENF